ncbi:hypothetical protein FF38_12530 [Lucilia cuprina]|uniref:Uncharacterized protein n=1 Tax=Lucilia cuprina TaxID=7375 RepID=A0A0L0BN93_LUCCU|nr:hypothetical protein FF38_12530 [Lucilia cuprina]
MDDNEHSLPSNAWHFPYEEKVENHKWARVVRPFNLRSVPSSCSNCSVAPVSSTSSVVSALKSSRAEDMLRFMNKLLTDEGNCNFNERVWANCNIFKANVSLKERLCDVLSNLFCLSSFKDDEDVVLYKPANNLLNVYETSTPPVLKTQTLYYDATSKTCKHFLCCVIIPYTTLVVRNFNKIIYCE